MSLKKNIIPFRQWDKRTPGKYEPEFESIGMQYVSIEKCIIFGGLIKMERQKLRLVVKEHRK